jgi:hypothetical protein
MTWVETLILVSFACALGGFMFGRHALARGIAMVSTVVFLTLLLVFGDEFLADLL